MTEPWVIKHAENNNYLMETPRKDDRWVADPKDATHYTEKPTTLGNSFTCPLAFAQKNFIELKAPVILYDDPSAATMEAVQGWVSRDGHFCGNNENLARSLGATHARCEECQAIVPKNRIRCSACEDARSRAKYALLPRRPWDVETPLVMHDSDHYFYDLNDVLDYAAETGQDVADLPLVICSPAHLHQIDAEDWADDLPEDGTLPDAVAEALETFNKVIAAAGPVSWVEGDAAAVIQL